MLVLRIWRASMKSRRQLRLLRWLLKHVKSPRSGATLVAIPVQQARLATRFHDGLRCSHVICEQLRQHGCNIAGSACLCSLGRSTAAVNRKRTFTPAKAQGHAPSFTLSVPSVLPTEREAAAESTLSTDRTRFPPPPNGSRVRGSLGGDCCCHCVE